MSDQTAIPQPIAPEDALAWEDAHRRTAWVGAVVGAVAVLVGVLLQAAAMSGYPHVPLLDALQHASSVDRVDLRVAQIRFIDDHAASLLFATILLSAGYATAMLALGFLFRATAARWERARRWILIVLLVGLGLIAVGPLVGQIALTIEAHHFITATNHGHDAANAVYGPALVAGQTAGYFGSFIAALGLIMVSLNAMRCGLLTKGIGTFGVINGAAFVIFLLSPAKNLLFAAWLFAVAALIARRWPSGVPPAWTSGEARPWPSAAEVRARREAARGEQDDDDEPEPVGAGAQAGPPNPSTSKRKRKRR